MSDNGVVPSDGMIITQDTRLAPGTYVLPNGITIAADNVTLDGTGALLVSREQTGVGIRIEGQRGVTIRGLAISGYYHGIRADHCHDLTIKNVRIRDTAEIEGIDTFLYLWNPIEEVYGGAILCHDVHGGAIRTCDLQHQMNGVLLYQSSGLTIEKTNASFNSGWGVYLSASNENTVQDNHLDFCNRLYRRPESGLIRAEADAAGIVLVYGSSNNQFLRNTCMCGGDGIFVAGYDHKGNQGPCNDNLFEDNDCRFSSNNAIESTFSRGNVFRRNDCSKSNYGFWMGYSWENVIEDNTIDSDHVVGIAVEHGFDFTIRNNRIRQNDEGIRLWTRGGPVVEHWPGHEVSYNVRLAGNLIEGNHTGFYGYTGEETTDQECHDYHLRGNTIRDNRIGARFGRVHSCTVQGNTFSGNVVQAIQLDGTPGVVVGDNHFDDSAGGSAAQ
ncbi:MAG: right-handed parallel beta-helix repeat-containing protein [Anaerolineae bacterium]|nr:right-handed parallel beta-helix repeat-containing protein [Anaerolineae bacterium]